MHEKKENIKHLVAKCWTLFYFCYLPYQGKGMQWIDAQLATQHFVRTWVWNIVGGYWIEKEDVLAIFSKEWRESNRIPGFYLWFTSLICNLCLQQLWPIYSLFLGYGRCKNCFFTSHITQILLQVSHFLFKRKL